MNLYECIVLGAGCLFIGFVVSTARYCSVIAKLQDEVNRGISPTLLKHLLHECIMPANNPDATAWNGALLTIARRLNLEKEPLYGNRKKK